PIRPTSANFKQANALSRNVGMARRKGVDRAQAQGKAGRSSQWKGRVVLGAQVPPGHWWYGCQAGLGSSRYGDRRVRWQRLVRVRNEDGQRRADASISGVGLRSSRRSGLRDRRGGG